MATATTTAAGALGACTEADLAELDEKAAAFRKAEADRDTARSELGATLRRLLEDQGAQRKALAQRIGKNDQTVSNLAYGRPGKK